MTEHLKKTEVCFFTLKDGIYQDDNGNEITTEMIMKHKHVIYHDNGYLIL